MPKLIQDEFTRLKISDQRRYQLRREKKGLCRLCGSPVLTGKTYCETHYARQMDYYARATAATTPTPALEDLI